MGNTEIKVYQWTAMNGTETTYATEEALFEALRQIRNLKDESIRAALKDEGLSEELFDGTLTEKTRSAKQIIESETQTIRRATAARKTHVLEALLAGMTPEEVQEATGGDMKARSLLTQFYTAEREGGKVGGKPTGKWLPIKSFSEEQRKQMEDANLFETLEASHKPSKSQ
jgi:hypothetical protein